MSPSDMTEWLREMQSLLAELATQDFGYPVGVNEVRQPVSPLPPLPAELEPLYAVSNGLSMSDVHVGYFIHPADRVVTAAQRGLPTRVDGASPMEVIVFGSDGGGSLFALRRDDKSVYYLPSSGVGTGGVFREDKWVKVTRLADSLPDFLRRLKDDLDAFVHQREGHEYMAR
jgi:hypothetical protein